MKKLTFIEILECVTVIVISICSLSFAITSAITGNKNDSILSFLGLILTQLILVNNKLSKLKGVKND
jgi:hypothetical protein